MNALSRVNVLGSQITICNMGKALDLTAERLSDRSGGYVCFTNVHAVVLGRKEQSFRAITNGSFMSLADGKPVYWVGRARKKVGIGHVPGPDFFIEALRRFPEKGHFFYGSSEDVLSRLTTVVKSEVPGLRICGSLSPPFRPLTQKEKDEHYHAIRNSGAAFIWVGLGAPKQEQWMAEAWQSVKPGIMFGVGAAFDFHAGTLRRAPNRFRHAGLEWLYRLAREPKRLWRRYLVTNSLFIYYLICERLGIRRFP